MVAHLQSCLERRPIGLDCTQPAASRIIHHASDRSSAVRECEAHLAIWSVTDMPGGQHQAIRRDNNSAATAIAYFHSHHRGGHSQDEGLDTLLDGPQVSDRSRRGFVEGNGQSAAGDGGWLWRGWLAKGRSGQHGSEQPPCKVRAEPLEYSFQCHNFLPDGNGDSICRL